MYNLSKNLKIVIRFSLLDISEAADKPQLPLNPQILHALDLIGLKVLAIPRRKTQIIFSSNNCFSLNNRFWGGGRKTKGEGEV